MIYINCPKGWVWTKVSDVIDKVPLTGKKLKKSDYKEEADLPVVDQGQSFIGGYTDNEELKINVEKPLIVFGDHTKIIKYIDFDFVAGADGVKVIKPQGMFYPKLFYYFTQAIQLPDKGYARHFQFLEKSQLPLPPLPEQHRIVLDAGIDSLKKAQAQLKRYRQSVLKAAVEGKLTEEWRKAHKGELEPASVLLERILKERREKWEAEQLELFEEKGKMPKDDKWKSKYKETGNANMIENLPQLSTGWIWTTVEQLASAEPNSIADGPFGSNLKTSHYTESGPRVVRLQNIAPMQFVNEKAHISDEHYQELKKHAVYAGDIVIA